MSSNETRLKKQAQMKRDLTSRPRLTTLACLMLMSLMGWSHQTTCMCGRSACSSQNREHAHVVCSNHTRWSCSSESDNERDTRSQRGQPSTQSQHRVASASECTIDLRERCHCLPHTGLSHPTSAAHRSSTRCLGCPSCRVIVWRRPHRAYLHAE